MSLLQHTQISAFFAVNVITRDDTGLHFAVLPLVSLGWLIMTIWRCRLTVNRFGFTLRGLMTDITNRLQFASKVLGIGFNALVWGLGL